jgi:hypothetical protein
MVDPRRRLSTAERSLVTITVTDATLGSAGIELECFHLPEFDEFAPGLIHVLYCGPRCHTASGVSLDVLSTYGCPVAERTFGADNNQPVVRVDVDGLELVEVTPEMFQPPAGFSPLQTSLWSPRTLFDDSQHRGES